jgi:hypothetical protein
VLGYGMIRLMLPTWAWFWSNCAAATTITTLMQSSTTTTTTGSASAAAFEEVPILAEEDEFAGSEF